MNDKLFRARDAWGRTGKPVAAVDTMTIEEIDTLSAMLDSEGNPVSDFRTRIGEFCEEYYESRKASEKTPPPSNED